MKLLIHLINSSNKLNTCGFSQIDNMKKSFEVIIKSTLSIFNLISTMLLHLSFSVESKIHGNAIFTWNGKQFKFSFMKTEFFSIFSEIIKLIFDYENNDYISCNQSLTTLFRNLRFLMVSKDFKSFICPYSRKYFNSKMISKMIFRNHHPQTSFQRVPCASEGSIVIAHIEVIYRLSSQGAGSSVWMIDVHPNKNPEHQSSKDSFLMSSRGLVTPFDRGKKTTWRLEAKWFLMLDTPSFTSKLNHDDSDFILERVQLVSHRIRSISYTIHCFNLFSIFQPTSFGEVELVSNLSVLVIRIEHPLMFFSSSQFILIFPEFWKFFPTSFSSE